MRPETGGFSEARGLWTGTEFIIKRNELASVESYASTLLHEIAHARSGEVDVTIGFEQELTSLLGMAASKVLLTIADEHTRERLPETHTSSRHLQTSNRDSTPKKKVGFWARFLAILRVT